MKHFKTGFLVMMTLFIVTVTTMLSCSKSDPAPPVTPAPTITSFTPASATADETVTITGTNFTGATSVTFGGTAAASYTVVSATSITAKLGTGATGAVKVVTAGGNASKDGFTFAAPQIDGYDNSNQVAKDSLKAHWSFDVDNREDISTKVPEKAVGAAALDAGVIGKGLQLTAGYLVFPVIPNLSSADALPSYTVSLWVNSPNASAAMSSFFQMTGEVFPDIWGQIQIAANTHWGKGGDTLALDGRFVQINGTGVHDNGFWDPAPGTFMGANKWSLLTITYDGPSHTLKYYGDGVLIDTRVEAEVVSPETFILQQPIRVLMGTFAYKEDGFANSVNAADRGWAGHGISASIDDVRVFSTPLTVTDVLALYHLGQAGR